MVSIAGDIDPIIMDILSDAQTSGGLIISVPEGKVESLMSALEKKGVMAADFGLVIKKSEKGGIQVRE